MKTKSEKLGTQKNVLSPTAREKEKEKEVGIIFIPLNSFC